MRNWDDFSCPPDCSNRSPTCHSVCERYRIASEKNLKQREARAKQNAWTHGKTETANRANDYSRKKQRGFLR